MQGTIVAMAAKMPEVILTEYEYLGGGEGNAPLVELQVSVVQISCVVTKASTLPIICLHQKEDLCSRRFAGWLSSAKSKWELTVVTV